nr:hypothetical protein [uncultured Desulfobulbus sp.]
MENTARKIVNLEPARVVGHIQLNTPEPPKQSALPTSGVGVDEDFLRELTAGSAGADVLRREHSRVVNEMLALQAENRWQDIVTLFHPLEEKAAALVSAEMDIDLRGKIAFALVRLRRNEEALQTLLPAARRRPEDALTRYTIGYAALDALFTARTERQLLPGKRRKELIELAHTHFAAARSLRPESVTFSYREAILFKDIEHKEKAAIPLFEQAIGAWDRQSAEEQQLHHQQRPKYIKSLYHLGSCLLKVGRAGQGLRFLERLEHEDGEGRVIHPLFRHFAFAKVLFALGREQDAFNRAETAAHVAERHQPTDFVWELAARCALKLQQIDKARSCIARVPEHARRPYVRWTEADVLAAAGDSETALKVLYRCSERDKRSRHTSLIRISRLLAGKKQYQQALQAAEQAVHFCEQTYGNPSKDAQFWQAANLHLLGRNQDALQVINILEDGHFQHPHFPRLAGLVRSALDARRQP